MTELLLRSDNVAGVSPAILEAMAQVAAPDMSPYGDDPLTQGLAARFGGVFGADCAVVPVGSGITANALALSLVCSPLDSVICSADAHIANSEGGAFEFYTGGAKLILLGSDSAKIEAPALERYLSAVDFARSATIAPRAVSLTQATERGLVYSPAEIKAIAEVAHRYGLKVHMDGARFANAVVSLGCTPGEASVASGVDILSFGATKNGAMSSEALVLFDRSLTAGLEQRRKRSGQLVSKMRFMAAQLHAYLADDLWIANATRANGTARRLAAGMTALPGITLAFPVEANLVFLVIAPEVQARFERAGLHFRRRDAKRPTDNLFRLVTSFATADAAVEDILDRCRTALR